MSAPGTPLGGALSAVLGSPSEVGFDQEEPRCVADALLVVPPYLRAALVRARATSPGVLRGLCDGSRQDAVKFLAALLPGIGEVEMQAAESGLLMLMELAGPEAERSRRRFAYMPDSLIIQEVLENAAAKRARTTSARTVAELQATEGVWRPAVRPARFRLRSDARLAAALGAYGAGGCGDSGSRPLEAGAGCSYPGGGWSDRFGHGCFVKPGFGSRGRRWRPPRPHSREEGRGVAQGPSVVP